MRKINDLVRRKFELAKELRPKMWFSWILLGLSFKRNMSGLLLLILCISVVVMLYRNMYMVAKWICQICYYHDVNEVRLSNKKPEVVEDEEYPWIQLIRLSGNMNMLIDHYEYDPDLYVYFRISTEYKMSELYKRKVVRRGFGYYIRYCGELLKLDPTRDKNFEEVIKNG